MPVVRPSYTCMRYMPQLRIPVSGFFVKTMGSVIYRPPSCGQQCRIGNSSSENPSRRITSFTGPSFTIFGKNEPISASFGSIFSLPKRPCGFFISRYSEMRAATSFTESTCSAISILRVLAKAFTNTGTLLPLGFSNSNAGPPVFTARSANSVISRYGSTSKGIRFSSLFFSSARTKSRKSL